MNRLKELRKQKHLTQKELGIKFGVTSQTILNWENELSELKSNILIELANYFNVTIDYLLGRNIPSTVEEAMIDKFKQMDKNDIICKINMFLKS